MISSDLFGSTDLVKLLGLFFFCSQRIMKIEKTCTKGMTDVPDTFWFQLVGI